MSDEIGPRSVSVQAPENGKTAFVAKRERTAGCIADAVAVERQTIRQGERWASDERFAGEHLDGRKWVSGSLIHNQAGSCRIPYPTECEGEREREALFDVSINSPLRRPFQTVLLAGEVELERFRVNVDGS